MVLDPGSALGLASNIFQVVDFSARLISKGNQYYKSIDGQLLEHAELSTISRRLVELNSGLEESLVGFYRHRDLSAQEDALKAVASDCKDAAQGFLTVLRDFEVSGNHRAWKSFRQAFKTVWSKEKMQEMLSRLAEQKQQVVLHLLVVNNDRQIHMSAQQDVIACKILEALAQINAKVELSQLTDAVSKQKHLDTVQVLEAWEAGSKPREPGLGARIRWGTEALEKRRLKQKLLSTQQKQWAQNLRTASLLVSDGLQTLDFQDKSQLRARFLASLHFQQITERRSRIPQAHAATFEWIYSQDTESTLCWHNFVSWLRDLSEEQNNLYWISGKAGSGKSTLMRYLYENARTQEHLTQWCEGKRLLIASCFFWNPGTAIQKSLQGLLRSLLHELLSEEQSLIPEVAPWRWRSYDLGATTLEDWTDIELLDALQRVVRQADGSIKIFLMVDGLDEFEANEEQRLELVKMFKNLATMPGVKICLSSRPWQVYLDNFKDGPSLRLQDLTHGDIRKYVSDNLISNNQFLLHEQASGVDSAAISQEIVEKAQGVFLWVTLVVASLQQGLRDGDSISDLMRRLKALPSDLEAYFKRLLESLDIQYRTEAAKLFQIVLRATRPISLMSVSFLNEQSAEFGCSPTLPPSSEAALSARLQLAERWLNTRCRGMLEVHETDCWSAVGYRGVDFLHRTVREFLSTEDVQQILRSFSTNPVNASYFLCQSSLMQIRMLKDVKSEGLFELIDEVMYYAQLVEESEPATTQELFEMVQSAVMHHRKGCSMLKDTLGRSRHLQTPFGQSIAHWTQWHCSFLTLAVQYGWENFVLHKLACELRLDNKPGRPLLDFSLRRSTAATAGEYPPLVGVVSLCLQRRSSANTLFQGATIFESFVSYMKSNASSAQEIDGKWVSDTAWAKATKLLIEHGAKQKQRVSDAQLGTKVVHGKIYRYTETPAQYHDLAEDISYLFIDGDTLASELRRANIVPMRAFRKLSNIVGLSKS